jgi:photosystem II stability/assembly factor-like uncharacterized protein
MKNLILIISILFCSQINLNAEPSDSSKWKLVYNLETDLPVKPNAEDSMYRWVNLYSIQRADSLNLYIFGNIGACYGLVLKSTDGGNTWFDIFRYRPCTNYGYNNKYVVLSTDSILYTMKGDTILRTTNGGLQWDTINTELKIPHYFESLQCLKNGNCYAKTGNYEDKKAHFNKSTDFGLTWDSIPNILNDSTNFKVFNTWFVISDSIYVCDGFYFEWDSTTSPPTPIQRWFQNICRTEDAGKTWSIYPLFWTDEDGLVTRIVFTDPMNGWLTASIDTFGTGFTYIERIYHTSDGGKTWELQYSELMYGGAGCYHFTFLDSLNAVAVYHDSQMLITSDGGKNWRHDTSYPEHATKWIQAFFVTYINPRRFLVALSNQRQIWMYDLDGFPDTGVDEPKQANSSIIPNPATENIEIVMNEIPAGFVEIEILDIFGRSIQKLPAIAHSGGEFRCSVDISSLAAGQYFMKINCSGNVNVNTFIKF